MTPAVVAVIVATLAIGMLIGSVGIGGVLLSPTLVYIAGVDVHEAMATSLFAFLFTGMAGTASFARRGTLDWRAGVPIMMAAAPGALLGAVANGLLSDGILKLILAVLLIAIGLYTVTEPARARDGGMPARAVLAGVGFVIGFGSGLTGTGGPVLAVPALLLLGVPALSTVALSQLSQLPIAAFGTIGFLLYGQVDLVVGAALGVLGAGGVALGARIAHAVPASRLRGAISVACIGAGMAIAAVLGAAAA